MPPYNPNLYRRLAKKRDRIQFDGLTPLFMRDPFLPKQTRVARVASTEERPTKACTAFQTVCKESSSPYAGGISVVGRSDVSYVGNKILLVDVTATPAQQNQMSCWTENAGPKCRYEN